MCQTGKPSFFIAAIVAFFSSTSCFAQLPTIELSSLDRHAGQLGSSVEVRCRGNRLDEIRDLIASRPGLTSVEKTSAPRLLDESRTRTNIFELEIAADCQPGLVDLRALGRFGLSNPRRFLVTSKPVVLANSNHADMATPLPLPGDAILVDRCEPQKLNYFVLELNAGDRLDCVAYAKPLDSQATLHLVLLDASGKELTRGRSKDAWPAEIHRVVETAGEHFIVVHDLLYRGGEEYPFVVEATVAGNNASPTTLELDQLLRPVIGEAESGGGEQPASFVAPFEVTGNFADASTEYDFAAKAGQQLSIRIESASDGGLTDASILLYKLDASSPPVQLAALDDGPSLGGPAVRIRQNDPALAWTAPADGSYRIVVRDNQAGDRPYDATQFVLSAAPLAPSFELVAYRPYPTSTPAATRPWGSNLMRSGTEAIEVIAIRRDGFAGAIELAIDGLPSGVSCRPALLPAGANEAVLVLECSESAAAWHGELPIVGRAKISEQEVEVVATAVSIAAPATSTKNAVQYRTTASLMAATNPDDIAPLLVALGDGSILEVAQGAKVAIPIKATRQPGGKAECVLRPKNLPPKTTLAEIKIPADKADISAELVVAADAPVGEYTFWMQNETKVRFRPNPQALEREETYLGKLTKAAEATSDANSKQELNAAIAATTTRVEELKKLCAEQEFTAWLPTTPQRIRILPKP